MSPYPSRRTPLVGAVLVLLALGVSGCGGGEAKADEPKKTASVTQSATPTPTPTPTAAPTPVALSPFEDRPPVQAARAWTAAAAKAVNAHEKSLASVAPLVTDQGMQLTRYFTKDDLARGYQLPGPEPFTPVSVRVRGAVAMLNVCLLNKGWSIDPATGQRAHKRVVTPAVMEMRKVGGAWKFDRYYAGTADCAGVPVRGVQW